MIHGILTWEVTGADVTDLPAIPLEVGQNVFLYPNHACVTGAQYKHYCVVDSEKDGGTHVQAVWKRGSGW